MGPIPACLLLLFVLLGIEPNLLELHNTDQVLCHRATAQPQSRHPTAPGLCNRPGVQSWVAVKMDTAVQDLDTASEFLQEPGADWRPQVAPQKVLCLLFSF